MDRNMTAIQIQSEWVKFLTLEKQRCDCQCSEQHLWQYVGVIRMREKIKTNEAECNREYRPNYSRGRPCGITLILYCSAAARCRLMETTLGCFTDYRHNYRRPTQYASWYSNSLADFTHQQSMNQSINQSIQPRCYSAYENFCFLCAA